MSFGTFQRIPCLRYEPKAPLLCFSLRGCFRRLEKSAFPELGKVTVEGREGVAKVVNSCHQPRRKGR